MNYLLFLILIVIGFYHFSAVKHMIGGAGHLLTLYLKLRHLVIHFCNIPTDVTACLRFKMLRKLKSANKLFV